MNAFQWTLRAAAVAMMAAAACHALLGVAAERILDPGLPAGLPALASLDSQNRFYGTMFGACGAVLWICAADLSTYDRVLRCLLWGCLAAGLARTGAVFQAGWPSPAVTVLWAVELVAAPAFLVWHATMRRRRPDA